MEVIKNIVFDLGGVLIHLEPAYTNASFGALAGSRTAYKQAVKNWAKQGLFEALEIGEISEEVFIKGIQAELPEPASPAQIETAWNMMLRNIPARGLQLVEDLKKNGFGVYLMSNTNSIHLRDFRAIVLEEHGIKDFDALFDGAYYSHLIGSRKPQATPFEYLVKDAQIHPQETLFIDDNAPNLVGARQAGLHTLCHPANTAIDTHLKRYLQLDF
ncbi:MAG: HAD family hydrolase [Aureispira sp.]